jgi:hypothetical protein
MLLRCCRRHIIDGNYYNIHLSILQLIQLAFR